MSHELANELGISLNRIHLVGSKLICGVGKDVDYLCLLDDPDKPEELGFVRDLEEPRYKGKFESWRRDDVNLLVATDPIYFASEVTIALAAKVFNTSRWDMGNREDRVDFHGFVRTHFQNFRELGEDEDDPFAEILG